MSKATAVAARNDKVHAGGRAQEAHGHWLFQSSWVHPNISMSRDEKRH